MNDINRLIQFYWRIFPKHWGLAFVLAFATIFISGVLIPFVIVSVSFWLWSNQQYIAFVLWVSGVIFFALRFLRDDDAVDSQEDAI